MPVYFGSLKLKSGKKKRQKRPIKFKLNLSSAVSEKKKRSADKAEYIFTYSFFSLNRNVTWESKQTRTQQAHVNKVGCSFALLMFYLKKRAVRE